MAPRVTWRDETDDSEITTPRSSRRAKEGGEGWATAHHVHCWLLLLFVLATGLLLPRAIVEPALAPILLTVSAPSATSAEAAGSRREGVASADARNDGAMPRAVPAVPAAAASVPVPGPAVGSGAANTAPGAGLEEAEEGTFCERSVPNGQPARRRPDWVFAADGASTGSWAAQFRFSAAGSADGTTGHLINRLSGGCINLRGGGEVRGHCNSDPQNRAAPPSVTTEMIWEERGRPPPKPGATCTEPAVARFHFTKGPGTFLVVNGDGTLHAGKCGAGCAAESRECRHVK